MHSFHASPCCRIVRINGQDLSVNNLCPIKLSKLHKPLSLGKILPNLFDFLCMLWRQGRIVSNRISQTGHHLPRTCVFWGNSGLQHSIEQRCGLRVVSNLGKLPGTLYRSLCEPFPRSRFKTGSRFATGEQVECPREFGHRGCVVREPVGLVSRQERLLSLLGHLGPSPKLPLDDL